MGVVFKHDNKIYQATNLDKKLKRLKIDKAEIEILSEVDNSQLEKEYIRLTREDKDDSNESWYNPRLYTFKNYKTGESIVSIYTNLNSLSGIVENVNDYEQTQKTNIENDWDKAGPI